VERLDFPIELKSYSEKVYIHLFTDIHMGAMGCDRSALSRDVKNFKAAIDRGEKHYWILGGDNCNSIGPKDRRHDSATIAKEFRDYIGGSLFDEERAALCAHLRPIRDWGIGVGTGNHEDKISATSEHHPAIETARQLDLPYLGYSAMIRLRLLNSVSKASVIVHWHHGRGAARTPGGRLNMLYAMRDVADADVYLTGHVHETIDKPDVAPLSVPRSGRMRLVARRRLFVLGATYQKSYSMDEKRPQKAGEFNDTIVNADYAEKNAYTPSLIGHVGFSVQMGRMGIKGTKSSAQTVFLKAEDFTR